MTYDIFISYKRKSLATANNLYYRLTTRGYSTFFDLEEMRRDNFNVQLLNYIENAKDVFVLLEEGSLDACQQENWEEDWFCKEISHALKTKKNIIPILIGNYKMPKQDFFPKELQELPLKNSLEFSFSYFEEYLNKLIEKGYITSEAQIKNQATSIFKFYSNENCQVYKEGKLVCSLEGMSDEPYYLPVQRKGDYRFRCVNSITAESKILKAHIDMDEEKDIDILWDEHKPLVPDQEWPAGIMISGNEYTVDLGIVQFNMIRVEGGEMVIGATAEQADKAENNEHPAHPISLPTYYIAQFPVTQNVWEVVMGYNKSHFKTNELAKFPNSIDLFERKLKILSSLLPPLGTIPGLDRAKQEAMLKKHQQSVDKGHYPAENLSLDEAREFVRRLSRMTNIEFDLPTEEEWEYAARGGQKSKHFRYAGSNNLDEVAWHRNNSERKTHPVGEKRPNELGLYDMCGNVWEWTRTPAHSYSTNIEPEGSVFIRRGGSWWHEDKNCRVSRRYASDRSKKTSGLGLRIVIRKNIK